MAGAEPTRMGHEFHPSILREYDIRGVVGQTLGADDARAIGRSFATLLRQAGGRKLVVGRDGRLSSPMLEAALVEGLTDSGVDVLRIGLSATPMLYYAESSAEEVQGGIQVTGSHNPADHNGFKIVFRGRPFFGADILKLGEIARDGAWLTGDAIGAKGRCEHREILCAYVLRLLEGLAGIWQDRLERLRIGWDTGNGAAGPAVAALTARLPGEHHLLFSEVDGRFPNHHPDPSVESNLADLRALVVSRRLDFGVAFDGDGDRIGVIDRRGRVIDADQLLMILAQDLLARVPGAKIIGDVKASAALFDRIAALGGVPLMWKSGHSQIKSKMKETGALLAGETSGHLFFAHQFHGVDDALYAAVQLIGATVRLGRGLDELRDSLPVMVNTPELRFAVDEARKFAAIAEIRARLEAEGAEINAIDGVRVRTGDGWWLLRASNTQAALTARAEAADESGLARLVAAIDAQLAASGLSREAQERD